MDTQLNYSQLIKNILHNYAKYYQKAGVPLQEVFDDEHQSYLLLKIGWQDLKHIHYATLHLQIIDNKIWIQTDYTEDGIATDLLAAGVPKHHIVLGFKHPSVRPHTEFAAA